MLSEFDIRVDRKTIFGNPFHMTIESQRNYVCDKYEEYFQDQLKSNTEFKQSIDELVCLHKRHGKLNLFCWCAPKRCHAETIKAYILKTVTNI
jgi:hypothetical protein